MLGATYPASLSLCVLTMIGRFSAVWYAPLRLAFLICSCPRSSICQRFVYFCVFHSLCQHDCCAAIGVDYMRRSSICQRFVNLILMCISLADQLDNLEESLFCSQPFRPLLCSSSRSFSTYTAAAMSSQIIVWWL